MVVSKIGGYAAPFGAPAGAQPLLLQNQIKNSFCKIDIF
jgi:hypothetical protein